MNYTILKIFTMIIVCTASVSAFIYLNSVELPEPASVAKKTAPPETKERPGTKKIVITDPKTNKKQLIIIEPPSWLDSTEFEKPKKETKKPTSTQPSNPGVLPDVEFFKFVIEKSRESIPVLSLNNYINFFW